MRELPSGTVTFLFSDVEGSTRLLEEMGEGYAEALAEHRRLLREAFTSHGGIEVDTQGDAFFVAFGSARAAAAAAEQAQAALAEGPLRVRMGLHTGEPSLTGEGYVGIDVHRAARICSAGHGGQVLLSEATARLLDGADLRDLGPHRLKDLGEPVRLYQAGRGEFPPLRALNQTNLPAQPTPFVGRDRELAEVLDLLGRGDVRLLTLTGPGGSGKTRLALHASAESVERFPDGVWWVPLAAVREPELVEPAIARALGADDLAEHLRRRETLLLLDNLEQVVAAAPLLGELLSAAPGLQILATSRAALRLRAEREYPVPPLAGAEAADLFVDRALETGTSEVVAHICRRLDCLPLAIELAAAATRVLSPERLLERLERHLPLPAEGARDAPERQRTLRATIEWSYNLLEDDEQRLFGRLGVFAGGFDVDACETICGADLATLAALVEKSLLRRAGDRFFMLETIREYAGELFSASADADHLRGRHIAYFLEIAERAENELRGSRGVYWIRRLEADHADLRAAIAAADAPTHVRLVAAVRSYWSQHPPLSEGRQVLEQAYAQAGADSLGRGQLADALAWAVYKQGDYGTAERYAEEAIELARAVDAVPLGAALSKLANVAMAKGDFERAGALYEESLALARAADDIRAMAVGTNNLGDFALAMGELERAAALFSEAIALNDRLGNEPLQRTSLANLAWTKLRLGDLDEAEGQLLELLEPAAFADDDMRAHALEGLAAAAMRGGEHERGAILLGAAAARRESADITIEPAEAPVHAESMATGRAALGEQAFEEALRRGRTLDAADAIAFARRESP